MIVVTVVVGILFLIGLLAPYISFALMGDEMNETVTFVIRVGSWLTAGIVTMIVGVLAVIR